LLLSIGMAGSEPRSAVNILINGKDLIEMVKAVELPFALKEGHPNIAGQYMGLSPEYVFLPSRHLLDKPISTFVSHKGKVDLFVCAGCDEPGCWPLAVTIQLADDRVTWRDFEQPHRTDSSRVLRWKYDQLGPFVFDRSQYEAELKAEGRVFGQTWSILRGIKPPISKEYPANPKSED